MSKVMAAILSVFVVIVVAGSVLAPILTASQETGEAIRITNEGSNDILLTKQTGSFALDLSVTFGDDVIITNGSDTITTTADPQIIIASDTSCIFFNEKNECVCIWNDGTKTNRQILDDDFTVTIADDKMTVDDGSIIDLLMPAAYLYVPSSTGEYGSFNDGELNRNSKDPVIAVGDYAGITAYNQFVSSIELNEHITATDDTITSVIWDAVAEQAADPDIDEFNPQIIDFDPISINPNPDASPAVVPTPTFTDGDWGYDLISSGAYSGKAKIVSYSGAGGGPITIPATIGGYDVIQVGKGTAGANQTVFDSNLSATDLIISDGIVIIGADALRGCIGFTGQLIIPDSVETIASAAFSGTRFSGQLIIPDSVETITSQCFSNCVYFTGQLIIPDSVESIQAYGFYQCTQINQIIIPDSVISIGNSAFRYNSGVSSMVSSLDSNCVIANDSFSMANLKEVLNLGTLELTTTSYGLNADSVQSFIGASSYIAPVDLAVTGSAAQTPFNSILGTIMMIVITSVLIAAVGIFLIRRD